MGPRASAALAAAFLVAGAPRLAAASGVAAPEGRYARVASETVVLVWDEATSLEEIVVQPEIETDAPTLAYVMATTSDVVVATAEAATIERARDLAKRPAPPSDAPTASIANVAIETLKRATSDEVSRWLRDHGFGGGGPAFAWAVAASADGRALTFVRASDPTEGRHVVRFPALRFAVHAKAATLPYGDADLDLAEHAAFLKRAGLCEAEPCRAPLTRALDVFVVSPSGVRLAPLDGGRGPSLVQALQVGGDVLPAIGGLRFPEKSRWTLTHFEDPSLEHDGPTELTFEALGERRPTVTAVRSAPPQARGHRRGSARGLFALVALLMAASVGVALRAARD